MIADAASASSIHDRLRILDARLRDLERSRDELRTLKDERYLIHEDGLWEQVEVSEKRRVDAQEKILEYGFSIRFTRQQIDELRHQLFLLAKERAARAGVVLEAPR